MNWGAIVGDDLGTHSAINTMYFIDLLTIDTSTSYITTGSKHYDYVDLNRFTLRATLIEILSSPYAVIDINLAGKELTYKIQTKDVQLVKILVTINAK